MNIIVSLAKNASAATVSTGRIAGANASDFAKGALNRVVKPWTPKALGQQTMRLMGLQGAADFFAQVRKDYKKRQDAIGDEDDNDKKVVKNTEETAKKTTKSNDILEKILDRSTETSVNTAKLLDITTKRLTRRSTDNLNSIEDKRENKPFVVGAAANQNVKAANDNGAGGVGLMELIAGFFTGKGLFEIVKTAILMPLGAALVSIGRMLGGALRALFNPFILMKVLTKLALPLTIIGSIASGLMSGFDEWQKTGDIGKAIVAGMAGVVDFLTFGLIDKQLIIDGINSIVDNFNKYVIHPIQNILNIVFEGVGQISDLAKKGLAALVQSIADGLSAMGGGDLPFVQEMKEYAASLRGEGPRIAAIKDQGTVKSGDLSPAQGRVTIPVDASHVEQGDLSPALERITIPSQEKPASSEDLDAAVSRILFPGQDSKTVVRDLKEAIPFITKIAQDVAVVQGELAEIMPNFRDKNKVTSEDLAEIIPRLTDIPVSQEELGEIIKQIDQSKVEVSDLVNAIPLSMQIAKEVLRIKLNDPKMKEKLASDLDGFLSKPEVKRNMVTITMEDGKTASDWDKVPPVIINAPVTNNNGGGGGGQDVYKHQPADSGSRWKSKWEDNMGF